MTTMFSKDFLHKKLPLMIFLLALLLFVLSLVSNNMGSNTDTVANKASHRLKQRIEVLDRYIIDALDTEKCDLLEMKIPDDMVIYRYVNDSLQSWCNQFSIINDDIANRMIFQRISDMNNRIESPLAGVTEEFSFISLGPKWYVIKAVNGDNIRVIAGIEIMNTLIDDMHKTENGVNPLLKINGYYSVIPLSYGSGYPVEVDGTPLFSILFDSTDSTPFFEDSALQWLAMVLLIIASIMFLAGHRTLKIYALVMGLLAALLVVSYIWGLQMNGTSELFSPTLYADGGFLFSFGALLLVNAFIFLFNLCTFLVKNRLLSLIRIDKTRRRRKMAVWGITLILVFIATFAYTNITLKSLIMNSNISLELYRWDENTLYTILVFISYTGLLACLLIQIQFLRPALTEFIGLRYNIFSPIKLILSAFLFSLYFTCSVISHL